MSSLVPSIDEITPAWGALPVEQYLIVSHFSTANKLLPHLDLISVAPLGFRITYFGCRAAAAPRQLVPLLRHDPQGVDGVRTPVTAENVEARAIRDPTADEVARILTPWRSPRWRSAAVAIWQRLSGHEDIWLRTHYADQGDGAGPKKLQEWLDEDPSFDPDQAFWRVLDDVEVFGFEAEWERVLYILPEIASAPQRYSRVIDGPDASDYERDALAECRDRHREELRNALD